MNIFCRLLVTIAIGLSSILLAAHAEGNNNMPTPNGLNQIQNAIQEIAKKNGMNIQLKWSPAKENEVTATIYYQGIERKITFNHTELEKAYQDHITIDTLNKIQKVISQLPGGSEPPGAPKK